MNHFPKVAKIARKRLLTILPRLNVKERFKPGTLNPEPKPINFYEMVKP